MKVSENWLREWVNPSITSDQLTHQLTMAGLEVDAQIPVAGVFDKVIVAHVIQTYAHPKADKLTLCDVDAGTGSVLKIVCGASNVRAGLKVALASINANLPNNFIIKETKIRGELSQGMLCSATELGLEEHSEGIMELPNDAPIGADLRDYLSLNDIIFDINLTPNRGDCFSMLGVAREVAALNQQPLHYPFPLEAIQPNIEETWPVDLMASKACPQYTCRIIKGINPHAITPLWMNERLRRAGIRTRHPVVDILNYVMLELGQPMHAFDLNSIEGNIQVRYAKPEEVITLLNDQIITLTEDALVIADEHKSLALAGVMGGEASCVRETTTDILIESAFFDPKAIASTARQYNLFSDSSQRFERGVDPALQGLALERATFLLQSIVGGQMSPIIGSNDPAEYPPKISLLFDPKSVKKLTGLDITQSDMRSILERLAMSITEVDNLWQVAVPSYRFDIQLNVDLVEEIIRLYGYDRLPSTTPSTRMQAGSVNLMDELGAELSSFFTCHGYHETISYSFVDPEFQNAIYPDSKTLALLNPISPELSEMRLGMWPGLIASMIHNLNRQQTSIKLFELGVVFGFEQDIIQEHNAIAGLITGEQGRLSWNETTRPFDFFDAKGDLQSLFSHLALNPVEFVAETHPALHPGKSARIYIHQKAVGWIGSLHPFLLNELELSNDVILFELSLASLVRTFTPRYQRISKYPQIVRDLALLIDKKVPAGQIETVIRAIAPEEILKSIHLFDVYEGPSIPINKKSLAISLTLQSANRTLVDEEVNAIITNIVEALHQELKATLRDTIN